MSPLLIFFQDCGEPPEYPHTVKTISNPLFGEGEQSSNTHYGTTVNYRCAQGTSSKRGAGVLLTVRCRTTQHPDTPSKWVASWVSVDGTGPKGGGGPVCVRDCGAPPRKHGTYPLQARCLFLLVFSSLPRHVSYCALDG